MAGTLLAGLLLPAWPTALLAVAGITLAALGPARVPGRLWWASVAIPSAFVVVGVVTVAIQVGGVAEGDTTWWRAGPLAVTAESVARAGTVLGRSLAGAGAVVLLAVTTPMIDLVDAGRRLRIPGPALDIAALMYRMLFLLWESAATLRAAQTSRLGYRGFRGSMHDLGTLTAGILTRSWARSRALEAGLAGRGYVDDLRTLSRAAPHDPLFLAATLAWLVLLAATGTRLFGVLP